MPRGSGKLRHFLAALLTTAFACTALPARADVQMTLLSDLAWHLPEKWFGGFSGLEVSPDGETMTAITDRGSIVTARLTRADGLITGVEVLSRLDMRLSNGEIPKGAVADAEGLAIDATGRAFVSFEFRHRVTRLDLSSSITTRLPSHRDFETLGTNAGLEALAIHPDGRLFTLAEGARPVAGTIPLYALSAGRWRIAHRLPTDDAFLPVGADFDPGGRLYLLERALTPLGFRSRIRRFDLSGPDPVAQTLLITDRGAFDNLEGLSVWTDGAGATRLILISDDNFKIFQRTQIVEYALTE
jgi:hypothetical protein